MRYEVQVAGQMVTLEVERSGSALAWKLGPEADAGDLVEVEPGVYSLIAGGRSFDIKAGWNADGTVWVDLDGRRRQVEVVDPRRNGTRHGRGHQEGRAKVAALMPGKVVRVLVKKGDAVTVGQGLVVVEAMKMQNEMKSPKDGTVSELKVAEGATVAPGEVLMIVE